MHFRRLIVLALFSLACSAPKPSKPITTSIQVGTFAQDWRNTPDWEKLTDFDYVSLSPRAQKNGGPIPDGGTQAAENLVAAGVKVLFLVFPSFGHYLGEPLPEGDWSRVVEDLAIHHDAILKKPDGSWVSTAALDNQFILDFRNSAFVRDYVALTVDFLKIGQGIHHHGACASMSWDPEVGPYLTAAQWEVWSQGYRSYFSQLRAARQDWEIIGVCDRWSADSWMPEVFEGIYFEHMGSSLNPVGMKVWNELTPGSRNVLALFETDAYLAPYRRGAAVMAILHDALFQYGHEATVTKDPEHFEMYYGAFADAAKEIATNVYERIGTHGLVVGNFNAGVYVYTDPFRRGTYTIMPGDGLAIQFKDRTSGADLTDWITNVGR